MAKAERTKLKTLRIPPTLIARIQRIADSAQFPTTFTALVEMALTEFADKHEAKRDRPKQR